MSNRQNLEYLEDKRSSVDSKIQTIQTEELLVETTQNKSIWGTFHFIAKSDRDYQPNTVGARAVSPVVDPNSIPQEVLEDIYGGE